ncbi:MAG: hypothetical protein ACREIU_11040, partial [Planctomycetota bacterium]
PGRATIESFREGRNPYDPALYAHPPFHFTLYPPLYFLLVAALPPHSGNPFHTGRVVALASMVLACAAVVLLLRKARLLWLAPLAFGVFFLLRPVLVHAAYVKCDSLALLLSALAVVLLGEGAPTSGRVAASALLAFLSTATKHSYVASAAAGFLHLLLVRRKGAFLFAGIYGGGVAVGSLLAILAWGKGFGFCLVDALRQPFSWRAFAFATEPVVREPVLGALLLLTAAGIALRGGATSRRTPYFPYLVGSTGVLLLTAPKFGSWTNYLFEFSLACVLFLVARVRALERPAGAGVLASVLLLGASACAETLLSKPGTFSSLSPEYETALRSERERLARDLRPGGSRILNLHSARYTYLLPEPAAVNDPFLYLLLWRAGTLDAAPLHRALREHAFDRVLVPRTAGPPPRPLRDAWEEAADILFREYPRRTPGPLFDVLSTR